MMQGLELDNLAGGCVCGGIRYQALNPPQRITVCHCLWCQRRTGTAFGTEVVFANQDLAFSETVEAGCYRHHSDESGRWLDVYFCSRCGSNLGFTLEVVPEIRTVPAGTLDHPELLDGAPLQVRQVFARSRRNWGDARPDVEVYEAHFR